MAWQFYERLDSMVVIVRIFGLSGRIANCVSRNVSMRYASGNVTPREKKKPTESIGIIGMGLIKIAQTRADVFQHDITGFFVDTQNSTDFIELCLSVQRSIHLYRLIASNL